MREPEQLPNWSPSCRTEPFVTISFSRRPTLDDGSFRLQSRTQMNRVSQPVRLPDDLPLPRGVHEIEVNGSHAYFCVTTDGTHLPGVFVAEYLETDAEVKARARNALNLVDPVEDVPPPSHLWLMRDDVSPSSPPPS
jgi:hypothetical protein